MCRLLRDQHLADARADVESVVRRARHEVAQHAARAVDRREEEEARLVLDVADGVSLEAGAADEVHRQAAAGAGPTMSACGSRAVRGAGASGSISVRRRNCAKRSGRLPRAGGTCTCATPAAGPSPSGDRG